jgi:hypothetical protein
MNAVQFERTAADLHSFVWRMGKAALALWLLVMSVNAARWREQASAA